MADRETFTQGQRVRFTSEALGAIKKDRLLGTRFTERIYGAGETGTVDAELPPDLHGSAWYAVTPDDDATVYVPVHASWIEAL